MAPWMIAPVALLVGILSGELCRLVRGVHAGRAGAMSKRTLSKTPIGKNANITLHKEPLDMTPILNEIENSIIRFRNARAAKGDLVAAMLDLTLNVEDLSDAVDKLEQANAEVSR